MPDVNDITYGKLLLPDRPTIDDIRAVARDYVAIIHRVMHYIADRYERSPYTGFIDTKFNIITGEDFSVEDPRGPKTVYSWIQGRGLEALVGHAIWLRRHSWADPRGRLVDRLDEMIRGIYEQLQTTRRKNRGRLFFFTDPTGVPFVFTDDGRRVHYPISNNAPYNFSDLFGSRGLYAAASYLQDEKGLKEATSYCLSFENALWDNRFESDQQKLPPISVAAPSPKIRLSHAPFTIQLATPPLMATRENNPTYIERGLRLMQHVLSRHVNTNGTQSQLHPHDFWEFVGEEGLPFLDAGRLILDPGHALEFVGLGLKLTRVARTMGLDDKKLTPFEAPMTGILIRSMERGYVSEVGGIRKQVDLLTERPIDDTMPWWSLPETMRAAILCWSVSPNETGRREILSLYAKCHNSFVKHYVRPDRHLFAVQTRSATGDAIDVIPATADADPGYHTGLSLIDVLDVLEDTTGSLHDSKPWP